MTGAVVLIPIDRDGTPRGYEGELPEETTAVFSATVELYDRVGFEEPWIGYLALAGSTPVGTCGFKSSPRDGRVELAYFTFPEFEGRGFATAMGAALVALARRREPEVSVAAQTLPGRNASHRVLEKLEFEHVTTVDHPEDGTVWEWRLGPGGGSEARLNEEHFRKLEAAYASAPINTFYSPTLRVSEGAAELTIDVERKMHHAAHAVHGSVYFKALDDAAFFAANSLAADVFVLTVSFTVYMMRPISAGRIRALGWTTHRTGRLFFAESKLEDQDGNEIARGSGTFMRSKIRLTPDIGYA